MLKLCKPKEQFYIEFRAVVISPQMRQVRLRPNDNRVSFVKLYKHFLSWVAT
jgi:hypothetical protein